MLFACSSSGGGGNDVNVTLSDFAIKPASSSISAGSVTFKLHNSGNFIHEFVVVKAPSVASIPTKPDGEANEDAITEPRHMGEKEDIQPGSTVEFKLKLDPGQYVAFCNRVDGSVSHYQRGMHTAFTVTK